jgi:glycosyltransferase involved in cell wall biosynthesis
VKILHVSTGRTWRGGERQNLLLMEGLRARGEEQILVAPRGSALATRAAAAGFRVHALSIAGEGDVAALARIATLVRRHQPDLLHLHTSQAHGLGAAAARLAGRRRPAAIVTRRVEHSIFRHSFLHLDRLKYAPGADRVLCVSERVRDVLRADGLPADRLVVVPDGVDVAAHRVPRADPAGLRASLGIPAGAWLIGTVGHLDRSKGHHHLVDALLDLGIEHRDAHLLLVGEGPARGDLDRQVSELSLGRRVTFAGFRDDVPDLLHALDVFAFPSTSEGLGSSVLEAMAAGVPVVATTAGGIPEAVRDGTDGLLVAPGGASQLAHAIRRVRAEPEAAARMVASAQERVASCYGAERMVAGTWAAYAAAVTRRAPPAPRPGDRRGGRASSGSS